MKKLSITAICLFTILAVSCGSRETKTDDGTIDTAQTTTPNSAMEGRKVQFPIISCTEGDCDLPADCDNANPCADADCYDAILACHQLTDKEFTDLVENYHQPAYEPKIIEINNVHTALQSTGTGCNNWIAEVGDYSTQPDNSNIEFNVYELPLGDTTIVVQYSVALFKALMEKKAPTAIHFYKGKHDNNCQDILFKAYNNGTEVYCGDLSGLYP